MFSECFTIINYLTSTHHHLNSVCSAEQTKDAGRTCLLQGIAKLEKVRAGDYIRDHTVEDSYRVMPTGVGVGAERTQTQKQGHDLPLEDNRLPSTEKV